MPHVGASPHDLRDFPPVMTAALVSNPATAPPCTAVPLSEGVRGRKLRILSASVTPPSPFIPLLRGRWGRHRSSQKPFTVSAHKVSSISRAQHPSPRPPRRGGEWNHKSKPFTVSSHSDCSRYGISLPEWLHNHGWHTVAVFSDRHPSLLRVLQLCDSFPRMQGPLAHLTTITSCWPTGSAQRRS